MSDCKYGLAWIGRCRKEAVDGDYCEDHKDIMCCSCGAKATHQCAETMGLVCGAPLCDDCEHTICSNGCNSGADLPAGLGGHCKKSEQHYLPWIYEPMDKPESCLECDSLKTAVQFSVKMEKRNKILKEALQKLINTDIEMYQHDIIKKALEEEENAKVSNVY